jgi:putative acetyltransferase
VAEVVIRPADPTSAAVAELLAALDAYQSALYPAESVHLLPAVAFAAPGVAFLGAFLCDRLVGCCGYITHADGSGELKRLFVRPEARGLGIARQLFAALEVRAVAAGLTVLRLETGVSQPHSIRVCEAAGYTRRGPFANYPDDPNCVFMEKHLRG